MARQRLMTPGPTPVPEAARLKMAEPLAHHRTPGFRRLLGEVVDGLRYVCDTTADVELVLAEMGQSVKLGSGVAAAGNVFLQEKS